MLPPTSIRVTCDPNKNRNLTASLPWLGLRHGNYAMTKNVWPASPGQGSLDGMRDGAECRQVIPTNNSKTAETAAIHHFLWFNSLPFEERYQRLRAGILRSLRQLRRLQAETSHSAMAPFIRAQQRKLRDLRAWKRRMFSAPSLTIFVAWHVIADLSISTLVQ